MLGGPRPGPREVPWHRPRRLPQPRGAGAERTQRVRRSGEQARFRAPWFSVHHDIIQCLVCLFRLRRVVYTCSDYLPFPPPMSSPAPGPQPRLGPVGGRGSAEAVAAHGGHERERMGGAARGHAGGGGAGPKVSGGGEKEGAVGRLRTNRRCPGAPFRPAWPNPWAP